MKISRWCSSSTSSRWWFQSASRFRDQCLSTTVLSHLHSRIAQGTHGDEYFLYKYSVYKSPLLVAVCVFVWVCQYDMYHDTGPVIPYIVIHYDTVGTIIWVFFSCSPSVSYLQPPSNEQYQITQSPSPCNPPQLQQQYSGERLFSAIVVFKQLLHHLPSIIFYFTSN